MGKRDRIDLTNAARRLEQDAYELTESHRIPSTGKITPYSVKREIDWLRKLAHRLRMMVERA